MGRQALHEAYLSSDYVVTTPAGNVTLRADGPPVGDVRAIEAVSGRRITVVTAWNPRSVEQSVEANRDANDLLRADLNACRWIVWDAVGKGRPTQAQAWSEDSFAVVDADPDEVRHLAHTYGQNAVLVWDGVRGSIVWCDA